MVRLPGSLIQAQDSGMGHFYVPIQISHQSGTSFVGLQALVDTGSTYTWIPRDVLEGLRVVPAEQRPFVLADGRRVTFPVAWVMIRLEERAQPTIVVFGEPGSQPILGAVTLEEHLLAVDPVTRRLVPVPGLLMAIETP